MGVTCPGPASNERGHRSEPETLCLVEGAAAALWQQVRTTWKYGPGLVRCPDFSGAARDRDFYVRFPDF